MFDIVIIGSGPAGTGLLSGLLKQSLTDDHNPLNLCLIEARHAESAGNIDAYNIPSDTRAEKFLTCLDGLPSSISSHSKLRTHIENLRHYGSKAVPLSFVGAFYRQLSQLICDHMIQSGKLDVRWKTKVLQGRWQDAHWKLTVQSGTHRETISTKQVVMACGASEPLGRLDEFLKSYRLMTKDLKAVQFSSDILKAGEDDAAILELKALSSPKIVILGGSHSAISSAGKLLSHEIKFSESAISILHRSPMQVTFDTPAEARKYGVTDFSNVDICPKTGRVFALKGFRLESRDLFLAVKGYSDQGIENRVVLTPLETISLSQTRKKLLSADLVISALGYTPNYIPLYIGDEANPIAFNAPNFVNDNSQLLSEHEEEIPNCYALGLASNYNLAERFGEPSFSGQANGLVLWFKDIGMDLAQTLLKPCP